MGYIALRIQGRHCSTAQVGAPKKAPVSYLPCVGFQGYPRVSHYEGQDIQGTLERRSTTRIVRGMSSLYDVVVKRYHVL